MTNPVEQYIEDKLIPEMGRIRQTLRNFGLEEEAMLTPCHMLFTLHFVYQIKMKEDVFTVFNPTTLEKIQINSQMKQELINRLSGINIAQIQTESNSELERFKAHLNQAALYFLSFFRPSLQEDKSYLLNLLTEIQTLLQNGYEEVKRDDSILHREGPN